jgi:ABC-type proline/glycine betaine transport system permease subunit
MKLIVAHQILIGSAIALAVLFGIRAAVAYAREGGRTDLVLAAVSAVTAVALGVYLRGVRAKALEAKRSGQA